MVFNTLQCLYLSCFIICYYFRERKGQHGKRFIRNQGMRNNKNQPPIKNRDASVAVRPDWTTIEEMDFPRLAKLSLPNVKEAEDT